MTAAEFDFSALDEVNSWGNVALSKSACAALSLSGYEASLKSRKTASGWRTSLHEHDTFTMSSTTVSAELLVTQNRQRQVWNWLVHCLCCLAIQVCPWMTIQKISIGIVKRQYSFKEFYEQKLISPLIVPLQNQIFLTERVVKHFTIKKVEFAL